MQTSNIIGSSEMWKKRAVSSVVMIMRKAEADNLLYTPLGRFNSELVEYLLGIKIIKPTEDSRFFTWNDYSGYSRYQEIKSQVWEFYLKGNRLYSNHSRLWEDIDYILTYKNEEYTFVAKEMKYIGDLNREADALITTENELKDYEIFTEWEKLNEESWQVGQPLKTSEDGKKTKKIKKNS